MPDTNLIITGFMCTGKTSSGRLVAAQLKRPFVDMDRIIEERAGCTIAEIFEREGEAAFRAMEAALCRELGARRGLVIATGGGALLDAANREALAASGWMVCLDVRPGVLLERLAAEGDTRPLLNAPNPAGEIERLLAARAGAYRSITDHVETSDLTAEQVAEEIVSLWQNKSFK